MSRAFLMCDGLQNPVKSMRLVTANQQVTPQTLQRCW